MDSGKNGDRAWPLWGLTTRTIQAMGLHRDGEKWRLPQSDIEERRYVRCYGASDTNDAQPRILGMSCHGCHDLELLFTPVSHDENDAIYHLHQWSNQPGVHRHTVSDKDFPR